MSSNIGSQPEALEALQQQRFRENIQSSLHANEASTQASRNGPIAAVGCRIKGLAEELRHGAPQRGMIGSAVGAVAGTLESGGNYLEEHDLRSMTGDLAGAVRTYPLASIAVCVGIGFVLGRTFRR